MDSLEQIFTEAEIKEIRGSFNIFDKNDDGFISKDEIRGILEGFGECPTNDELDAMVKTADVDGDGKFGFYDFAIAICNKSMGRPPTDDDDNTEDLKRAFEMCDISKTGYLTIADMSYVFKCIGMKVSIYDLLDLMAEADSNNDDQISFEEFVACLKTEDVAFFRSPRKDKRSPAF
ncbi:uncharacterized protein LOC135488284 [Lineus longissimus]|uniref:uncharacterized protein LOC135488284 n=1 Tax=Lineus longissimus TaxID=88925 RepID=UPI002B4CCF21